jgi:hypothetical protein
VAAHLGVSEDLVRLIAEDLSDEDGCIIVMGITDEDWTPASPTSSDAVRELIAKFSQLDLPLTTRYPRS